jgi:nitrile hydratase
MGGMMGFGAISPEADEPVFHADWEARVLALTLAVGRWGNWNIDAGRHLRELQAPADYLAWSYYRSWLDRLEKMVVLTGLVTPAELESGRPAPGSAKAERPLTAEAARAVLAAGGPSARDGAPAGRFKPGDRVRARNLNPEGHTRLPRYARGHVGVIAADHGAHVLPDANAHFRGEDPRRLYTVRFEAAELWGEARTGAVMIDLWDPYLDPA